MRQGAVADVLTATASTRSVPFGAIEHDRFLDAGTASRDAAGTELTRPARNARPSGRGA